MLHEEVSWGAMKLTLQSPYPNIIQNLCALLGIYLTFARRLIS